MATKPEAAEAAPAPVKSKKMLFIIIGAVLVLALGGGGAFFYMSKQRAAAADGEEAAPEKTAHVDPKRRLSICPWIIWWLIWQTLGVRKLPKLA